MALALWDWSVGQAVLPAIGHPLPADRSLPDPRHLHAVLYRSIAEVEAAPEFQQYIDVLGSSGMSLSGRLLL